ncbi:hypothetical protein N9955_01050 [bacterium]|nr:hypothetical protein [bacterium]
MNEEKEKQLKEALVKTIVERVTFAELLNIITDIANREIDFQLKNSSEEEKEEVYKQIFENEEQTEQSEPEKAE